MIYDLNSFNMLSPILCSHPVVICNPHLYDLLSTYRYFVFNGKPDYYYPNKHKYLFSPKHLDIDITRIAQYYVNTSSGPEPMYYVVPCNHCVLCQKRKKKDLSFRFEVETSMSKSKPLFVTVTYDPEHLPMVALYNKEYVHTYLPPVKPLRLPDDKRFFVAPRGLLFRDWQLFMKRLRKYFSDNEVPFNIRYYMVGEYGKKTRRPHYHAVFWNAPSFQELNKIWLCYLSDNPDAPYKFRKIDNDWKYLTAFNLIIRYKWQLGSVTEVEYAGESKRNKKHSGSTKGCAKYVAKYVVKDGVHPKGQTKPRSSQSVKNGGIGMLNMSYWLNYVRQSVSIRKITVKNPYSMETTSQAVPMCYARKIYPTISTLVPKDVRDAWKLYRRCMNTLLYMSENTFDRVYFRDIDEDLHNKFRYLPLYDKFDHMLTPYELSHVKFVQSGFDLYDEVRNFLDSKYYDIAFRICVLMDSVVPKLCAFDKSPEFIENELNYTRLHKEYIRTLSPTLYDTDIEEFNELRHQEELDRKCVF